MSEPPGTPKTPAAFDPSTRYEVIAAVKRGDVQGLARVLDAGANPNVKDEAGWTPVHVGAWSPRGSEPTCRAACRISPRAPCWRAVACRWGASDAANCPQLPERGAKTWSSFF